MIFCLGFSAKISGNSRRPLQRLLRVGLQSAGAGRRMKKIVTYCKVSCIAPWAYMIFCSPFGGLYMTFSVWIHMPTNVIVSFADAIAALWTTKALWSYMIFATGSYWMLQGLGMFVEYGCRKLFILKKDTIIWETGRDKVSGKFLGQPTFERSSLWMIGKWTVEIRAQETGLKFRRNLNYT